MLQQMPEIKAEGVCGGWGVGGWKVPQSLRKVGEGFLFFSGAQRGLSALVSKFFHSVCIKPES